MEKRNDSHNWKNKAEEAGTKADSRLYTRPQKVKEYNYCLLCGKRLKTVEARILGYGTICYEKHKKARKNGLF